MVSIPYDRPPAGRYAGRDGYDRPRQAPEEVRRHSGRGGGPFCFDVSPSGLAPHRRPHPPLRGRPGGPRPRHGKREQRHGLRPPLRRGHQPHRPHRRHIHRQLPPQRPPVHLRHRPQHPLPGPAPAGPVHRGERGELPFGDRRPQPPGRRPGGPHHPGGGVPGRHRGQLRAHAQHRVLLPALPGGGPPEPGGGPRPAGEGGKRPAGGAGGLPAPAAAHGPHG